MNFLRKYIPVLVFASVTVTFCFFDIIRIGSYNLSGLNLIFGVLIYTNGNSFYLEPRILMVVFFVVLICGTIISIINLFLKNNLSKTIFILSLSCSLILLLDRTIFSNKLTPERWNSGYLIPVEYLANFWFIIILFVFEVLYLYFISIMDDVNDSFLIHNR